jgi:hypothetical protein
MRLTVLAKGIAVLFETLIEILLSRSQCSVLKQQLGNSSGPTHFVEQRRLIAIVTSVSEM